MRIINATLVLVLLVAAAGCTASSRQRPIDVGDVNTGTGSLAATRKQFEGSWKLVSLHISSPDGKKSDLDATGSLVSDAFGVLSIEYRMSEQGVKTMAAMGIKNPNPVVSTTGQAVFDVQQQRVTYTSEDFEARSAGFDPKLAAARANPFALERIRYYSFESDGTLRLATKYDGGSEAIVSRWRK